MYDIAIIGAGPAGATLARLVGNKYKVLLLERRTFEQPLYTGHQKCCGGLLDPDAQYMLATFGLGLPKTVIASPQMFAVRTIDFDNSIERYYQRHYVNVDREEFDKWTESLVPDEVDIRNGSSYLSHEILDDHVRIRYSQGKNKLEADSRIIVGADGAYSAVRRHSFLENDPPKRYIALQEWFENSQNINYYGALFDEDVTDFYSWIIPKDDYLILGSALEPRNSTDKKFSLLKEKLKRYGFELNKCIRRNGTNLLRPQSSKQINIGRGSIALVGEAAGFISPSSAEGFSYAFRSALALADSLVEDFEGWEYIYKKKTIELERNITFKILKSPFMYNKRLRRLVMKTGLKSVNVIPGSVNIDLKG
ncbi:MAG: FAD-binding protein [bacterium]|nr:FAD-binding protein [bacterium]